MFFGCKFKLGHSQCFFLEKLILFVGHSGDGGGSNPNVCSALFGTASAASGGQIKSWGGNELIAAYCRCCGVTAPALPLSLALHKLSDPCHNLPWLGNNLPGPSAVPKLC